MYGDYRQRLNGSMSLVQVPTLAGPLGTVMETSMNMAGTLEILEHLPVRLDRKKLIHGVFLTFMVKFRSGVRIVFHQITVSMTGLLPPIQVILNDVSIEEVHGLLNLIQLDVLLEVLHIITIKAME